MKENLEAGDVGDGHRVGRRVADEDAELLRRQAGVAQVRQVLEAVQRRGQALGQHGVELGVSAGEVELVEELQELERVAERAVAVDGGRRHHVAGPVHHQRVQRGETLRAAVLRSVSFQHWCRSPGPLGRPDPPCPRRRLRR